MTLEMAEGYLQTTRRGHGGAQFGQSENFKHNEEHPDKPSPGHGEETEVAQAVPNGAFTRVSNKSSDCR